MARLAYVAELAEAMEERIAFLQNFAKVAPRGTTATALEAFGYPQGDEAADLYPRSPEDGSALAAAAALVEAAELAFAIDRTWLGVQLAGEALDRLGDTPAERQPIVRMALLGSITGGFSAVLSASGPSIERPLGRVVARRSWAEASHMLVDVGGSLMAAAMASMTSLDALSVLFARDEPAEDGIRLARIALLVAQETAVLPAFGVAHNAQGLIIPGAPSSEAVALAWSTFDAAHARYASRLRVLRYDELKWRQARFPAPVLDWPLLGLHVGLLRAGRERRLRETLELLPQGSLEHDLAWFLWRLAGEIDKTT